MTAFDALQQWLRGGGRRPEFPEDAEGAVLGRVVDAVEGTSDGSTSPVDLAPLLRHAMAAASHGGEPPSLWVPSGGAWPSREHYRRASVVAAQETDGLRIRREPWRPNWLA